MRVEGRDGKYEVTQCTAILVCLPTGAGYYTLLGNKNMFTKSAFTNSFLRSDFRLWFTSSTHFILLHIQLQFTLFIYTIQLGLRLASLAYR